MCRDGRFLVFCMVGYGCSDDALRIDLRALLQVMWCVSRGGNNVSYRINHAELRRVVEKKLEEGNDVANSIRNGIIRRQPSDTGRTRAAWRVDRRVFDGGRRVTWQVANNVQSNGFHVWQLLHSGTGVYGPKSTPIRPVSAKVLRFRPKGGVSGRRGSGGWVFAKEVAGIKPSGYIVETLAADVPSGWRVTIHSTPGSAV